jgi:hypothetical protein
MANSTIKAARISIRLKCIFFEFVAKIITKKIKPLPLTSLNEIGLSLNPSPRGEGLNRLIIIFLCPFSPGRRGRGMRWIESEKGARGMR